MSKQSWDVSSTDMEVTWDVSVQPLCPPPLLPALSLALLISSTGTKTTGRNTSRQSVLSGWEQHAVTRKTHTKMQECPRGLSAQLEGQPGPSSSSMVTRRVQLQHPHATVLVGWVHFLGLGGWGGGDRNPSAPP